MAAAAEQGKRPDAGHSLTGLKRGEALCDIRAEAKTRKVVAWTP